MTDARFRFAADILRRLGEELNPSPDQGIIELVKNAYDADALKCHVELENVERPGGTVRVTDDGDGMAADDIINGWLVLGRSNKVATSTTRRGRRPAGSKGLGRLAALRLGTQAAVATRPRSEYGREYSLSIDWGEFDNVGLVDDVPLTIQSSAAKASTRRGTIITLSKLRSRISRTDVKKLARGLILLADPFGDDPSGFKPTLEAPEFSDLERLVKNRYFEDADYHLTASLDDEGLAHAVVSDFKGEPLFEAKHEDIARDRAEARYAAPPLSFDLWVFILNQTSFQLRTTTLGEVRDWLGVFGGVHVYQNGIRVSPYGNPGNDWLDMNLRRVRSPEERPGTNTSIGRVAIRGGEQTLLQKTDRSGFIESDTFSEVRAFAHDATEWMARRRMDVAVQRRAKERSTTTKTVGRAREQVESAISKAPAQTRAAIVQALGVYDKSREREATQLRKDVQLYRTLSTAGITAATFAHESSGNPIKVISHSIKIIERRSKRELGTRYADTLAQPVDSISGAVESLAVLGTATLSLISHQKRRLGRVDLHKTIQNVVETFRPFLDGREVQVDLDLDSGSPFLRGSEAAVESIVTNFLNNSLTAFEEGGSDERRIEIQTRIEDAVLKMHVLDSGPGIDGIGLKDIWLPGETTRPNGTGLGLAIVRDTVLDLGGAVDAEAKSTLGGARLTVELPLLGR